MNTPARYAALLCPMHGTVYIGFSEYVKQLTHPDKKWECPDCGRAAIFDSGYFDKRHPTDAIKSTQERSKMEQSYTHEQVKELVNTAAQYTDDIEDAIKLLGSPDSYAASAKASASRVYYLAALKPFQHLRTSK